MLYINFQLLKKNGKNSGTKDDVTVMNISYFRVTLHATRTTLTVKIFFIVALLNIPIINDPFEAFESHKKVMHK